jgi:hypothetical protein
MINKSLFIGFVLLPLIFAHRFEIQESMRVSPVETVQPQELDAEVLCIYEIDNSFYDLSSLSGYNFHHHVLTLYYIDKLKLLMFQEMPQPITFCLVSARACPLEPAKDT